MAHVGKNYYRNEKVKNVLKEKSLDGIFIFKKFWNQNTLKKMARHLQNVGTIKPMKN